MSESNEKKSAFEQVTEKSNRGVIGEFWDFLKYSKKWWLTPVLIAVLLFGALVIVSGSSIAPLIYAFW
ncbi:MAG: DUF5989 family protein [Pirellulaceae bacterium]|nr:DUF5989 family protein [Pirellulaceae bacterium]